MYLMTCCNETQLCSELADYLTTTKDTLVTMWTEKNLHTNPLFGVLLKVNLNLCLLIQTVVVTKVVKTITIKTIM